MRDVEIRGEMIRLSQLLKLADLIDSGGDARQLLRAGRVTVNGEPEVRRGRKMRQGDIVTVGDQTVRVV